MRIHLAMLTLGPAVLVSGLASYGFADAKSHKEMWSDPVADKAVVAQAVNVDGMVPFYPDMQPHPIAQVAGPMVAELGHLQGARTLTQEENPPGVGASSAGAVGGAAAIESMQQGEKLSDEKILDVTHFANADEVEQSRLAASRALDPSVRDYARMMVRMHSAADRQDAEVAYRRRLKMVSSKTSDDLVRDDHATMDMLKSKQGAEFDHAYMDAQVRNHQTVLDLIDTSLQPNAHDKAVKRLVTGLRPVVQSHLDQARNVQMKLKE